MIDFLNAHGGLMAVVTGVLIFSNAVLSAVRDLLYKYDGVAPGAPIPPEYAGLTKVNIACIWAGTILDYIQGNRAH